MWFGLGCLSGITFTEWVKNDSNDQNITEEYFFPRWNDSWWYFSIATKRMVHDPPGTEFLILFFVLFVHQATKAFWRQARFLTYLGYWLIFFIVLFLCLLSHFFEQNFFALCQLLLLGYYWETVIGKDVEMLFSWLVRLLIWWLEVECDPDIRQNERVNSWDQSKKQ